MIVYDVTIQGRPDGVPKEVAIWLLERNSLYPNIDFIVGCWEPSLSDTIQWEEEARKYSRIFVKDQSMFWGISLVIFPYLSQFWTVRIVGLINEQGEILSPENPAYEEGRQLSMKLRFEIAAVPEPQEVEMYGDHKLGLPRKENEPVLEAPGVMMLLPPDFRWTSEVSMSGEELGKLLNDPQTGSQTARAIWEKDWETLKHLKEGGN